MISIDGKVTHFVRRILFHFHSLGSIVRVFMDEYLGDFLFDTFQPFHFYRDESVDYRIPALCVTKEDFIGESFYARSVLFYLFRRLFLCQFPNRFDGFIAAREYAGSVWFASKFRN